MVCLRRVYSNLSTKIDGERLPKFTSLQRAASVGGTPPELAGGGRVQCAPASYATLHLRLFATTRHLRLFEYVITIQFRSVDVIVRGLRCAPSPAL